MAKRHLLPSGNEEFLDRLGLTDIDQRVYIAILDGGLVSAGEVQQLTDTRDLGRVLESIRDLIDLGLVKKAKGMMPRYYASLPFFRETLSVEREFRFALESMLQSLKQTKENTEQNEERIKTVTFPKIVNNLLDQYYEKLFVPVIQQFEDFNQKIEDETLECVQTIDDEIQKIKEEISLMLKPLQNYAELLSQKFDLGIINEEGELLQYTVQRKKQRLDVLQTAHKALGEYLNRIEQRSSKINSKFKNITKQMSVQKEIIENNSQTFSQLEEKIAPSVQNQNFIFNEIQVEITNSREQIKSLISTQNSDTLSNKIDDIFEELTNKVSSMTNDPTKLLSVVSETKTQLSNLTEEIKRVHEEIDQELGQLLEKDGSDIEVLKNKMGTVLNTINKQDDDSLQLLRDGLKDRLNDLQSNIVKEGQNVKNKLHSHLEQIENDQKQSLKVWKEKMIDNYQKPIEINNSFLENWVEKIKPVIDNFKQEADGTLTEILDPILIMQNKTFSALSERLSFIKAMVEARANDLQQILEMAQSFDYTRTSDTWVVVGLPGIYASLTDLLLRSKSKVTVVTPHLDLELVDVALSMRSSIRITFVADIDQDKDARLIKRLEEVDRIHLRSYPDRNLYACIRDVEEIIFGYIREGEETVGIRSSTPSVVRLLEDRLNETVLRNSKEI